MHFIRLVLGLCSAGLLCGCGTLININGMQVQPFERDWNSHNDGSPPNFVFGGLKTDAQATKMAARGIAHPGADLLARVCAVFDVPFWIADMPLSLVGDTLSLPFTISATNREARLWREVDEKQWADFDDEDQPATKPEPTADSTDTTMSPN